jgi:carbonic anhydrase/acetyltransferase-like protein (isoleucine patch superfamily)
VIRSLGEKIPLIDDECYIDKAAQVIGDVRIAKKASVWPGAVLRADDHNFIEVGEGSNIQDGTVCHVTREFPLRIGKYVTIGHRAVLHACTIEDEARIGMGAIILDGAVVGKGAQVGAGALVPAGMQVPEGSLALGIPAKIVRSLSQEEQDEIFSNAIEYIELWKNYYAVEDEQSNQKR